MKNIDTAHSVNNPALQSVTNLVVMLTETVKTDVAADVEYAMIKHKSVMDAGEVRLGLSASGDVILTVLMRYVIKYLHTVWRDAEMSTLGRGVNTAAMSSVTRVNVSRARGCVYKDVEGDTMGLTAYCRVTRVCPTVATIRPENA